MKYVLTSIIALTLLSTSSCGKKDTTTTVGIQTMTGIFVGVDAAESTKEKPAIMVATKMLRSDQIDTVVFVLDRIDANELLASLDQNRRFIRNAPRDIVCTFRPTCEEASYYRDQPNKIYILADVELFETKLNAQLGAKSQCELTKSLRQKKEPQKERFLLGRPLKNLSKMKHNKKKLDPYLLQVCINDAACRIDAMGLGNQPNPQVNELSIGWQRIGNIEHGFNQSGYTGEHRYAM